MSELIAQAIDECVAAAHLPQQPEARAICRWCLQDLMRDASATGLAVRVVGVEIARADGSTDVLKAMATEEEINGHLVERHWLVDGPVNLGPGDTLRGHTVEWMGE